jgi:AcrR family transcriptional regulator
VTPHDDQLPTPPPLEKPRQERAQVTQAAIIKAAATIFAERGYARTTLDVVAVAAGVTKGALYFHFASKHDLANAVIAEETRITTVTAQETLDAGYSAIETLIRLNRNLTEQIVSDVVVAAGVKLTTEELVAHLAIEAPYAVWTNLYVLLFQRAIDAGELRAELDAALLSRFVVGAFTGVHLVSNSLTQRADVFDRVREMWELMLPGISSPEYLEAYRELPALVRP